MSDLRAKTRKKKRNRRNLEKDSIIATIITGIILVLAIITSNIIVPTNNNLKLFALGIVVVVMIISGVLFIIFLEIFLIQYISRKSQNAKIKKVQRKLSSTQFTEVALKNWNNDIIPVQKVHCLAKIGKDGKIVYRIRVYYEGKISTNSFLNFFKV